MKWSFMMKINESTLQSILKAYGKELKPKDRPKAEKPEPTTAKEVDAEPVSKDLDIVNYDKDGNVKINPKQKDALIDFFE